MVDLIYVANPIAQALMILLEESGLKFNRFSPQSAAEGLYVPPVLLDDEPLQASGQVEIFHPGLAMVYLAEKAKSLGKAEHFFPENANQALAAEQWVIWQTVRQAFRRSEEDGTDLTGRANQLFSRINTWLSGHKCIIGNQYTIADMMCYPWIKNWLGGAEEIEGHSDLSRWFKDIGSRDAVREGMRIGTQTPRAQSLSDPLSRAIQFSYLPGKPTLRLP